VIGVPGSIMAEQVLSAAQSALDVPWLAPQIEQLRRARSANRYPTGLLIHDGRGAGGEALGRFAAQLALCREPGAPCGRCRDCRMFRASQHPDFIEVHPIEDSKLIRVEQVRELSEQLVLTSHGGGATVALISPADSMNANAANALLKSLEEPRAAVTLILVSATPSRLPATILSRCLRLRIAAPARVVSVAWLERHKGPGPWSTVLDVLRDAPFEALQADPAELARLKAETDRSLSDALAGRMDIPGTAERWARGESLAMRLACLETWITARIDDAVGRPRQSSELRSSAHLPESGSDMNIAVLLRLLDGIYELRRLRLTSINRSLALEQLLWQLPRARQRGGARARVDR
jgi:DNA polymerase III subunit delta'